MIELRVFALLLKCCSQIAQAFVGVCPKVSSWQPQRKLTTMTILAKQMFGMFYDCVYFKHIPTSAYTTLAEMFQQEFTHPKFKHTMELRI